MRRTELFVRILFIIIFSTLPLAACSVVPDDFDVDAEVKIETGKSLLELLEETRVVLEAALELAGEESRATIESALENLAKYSLKAIAAIGDETRQTIDQLSGETQVLLAIIRDYSAQMHGYALDIIQASGEEARLTIRDATENMAQLIGHTKRAIDNTVEGIEHGTRRVLVDTTRGIVYVVDTITDRILVGAGLILSAIFLLIVAIVWGLQFWQQQGPRNRVAASIFMIASIMIALAPLALTSVRVRAQVMKPVTNAEAYRQNNAYIANYFDPKIYRFVPQPLIMPVMTPTPFQLYADGNALLAWGSPEVRYGDVVLPITGMTDKRLDFNLDPLSNATSTADSIEVRFVHDEVTIVYAVAVQTATPTATPTPIDSPTPEPIHYQVTVRTANEWLAGTDARVYMTLIGETDTSPEIHLTTPGSDLFERDQSDTFAIQLEQEIGELKELRIRHDNTGSGAGWKLASVTVEQMETEKSWHFPCGRWLADDEEGGKVARKLTINGICE